jgi:hypothetical protein
LIERVETSVISARQAARQRLRRLAEEWVRQAVVRRAKVRMIEEVEELAPETKPHLLGEVKFPLKRYVSLPGSKASQYVAAEIALLPSGRGS